MIFYRKDIHNIVTLTLDMEQRPHNIINHEIWEAFVPVIKHLQEEKKKGTLRGVILTSEKKTFLAGGDLEYLYQAQDPKEIFLFSERMKEFLRDLEHPGVPVVAAINGSAIGAGFEVALACHRRIVVDDPSIQLGLPEVELGLIPGGGGIIPLMWLLGIEQAFYILSSGRRYIPREAQQLGMIDELATNHKDAVQRAKQWLLKTHESRRLWDQEGGAIPGGNTSDFRVAGKVAGLVAELAASTHNNFPAPQAILNALSEGSKVDFDTACRIESRYYTQLVRSQQCKNMIKALWFDKNFIKNGEERPRGYGRFRPQRVGIIGAGIMGSGIALACLLNGLEVVIKDVSKIIAERGRDYVRKHLRDRVERGLLDQEQAEALMRRVQTTEESAVFGQCDLVIEAVFENANVKQKVTREAEASMDTYSFFATNTISIPITSLSRGSSRPENYIGLHFFPPAEEVPLVEIIRGDGTSDETVARAFDFVKAINKTPIIVKDDWGFYAARVQNTFILEGITLLQEGVPAALIENLGLQAGMPKGALQLADDLGLDIVIKYERQAAGHYGPKYIQHPAVKVMDLMLEQQQRIGRRKHKGFYEYLNGKPQQIWTELPQLFSARTGAGSRVVYTGRRNTIGIGRQYWQHPRMGISCVHRRGYSVHQELRTTGISGSMPLLS